MPFLPKETVLEREAGRLPSMLSKSASVVFLYGLFAAISIAANLGAQKLFLLIYGGKMAVAASVLIGTAVGLVTKFALDKTWIFKYQHRDLSHGFRNFMLYSVMGVVTTAVFWGFEFGAEFIFGTETARFTGGAMGLSIGYIVKYWLDKRFVFAYPASS